MDQALADAPDGQNSLTDPDAWAMATSARHSGMVGYNVQTPVDTETHRVVAHDVTNQGFDRDHLSPMAVAAREALLPRYRDIENVGSPEVRLVRAAPQGP
ncbi:hypothetical protein SAMN05216196_11330 [Lutimaribacter pacificus]|uniref:Uncharacterized protein n=1 Tax=Lutimaribacter pacificus TaxID=391948 RepID=A0A1H0NI20_9RHOB|nr:hypothetical protein SAMN05216196_11330 [Lutimaribacter pacificus]SHK89457.1 hypothetical protein SAMN05444142_11252 [Lutimaribacter pacificus]